MTTVHNPDQYMLSLRQIIAQGRKRVGLLIGAGAPAGMQNTSGGPLIPAVGGLTTAVLANVEATYGATTKAICAEFANPNIEDVLS